MNLSILKSDKKNLNSFITAGSALIFIGFIDIMNYQIAVDVYALNGNDQSELFYLL